MQIGRSSCNGKCINDELFKDYALNGITHMELSMPDEDFEALDFANTKALADKYGITLWSMHLPFYGEYGEINPASLDAEVRKYTFDRFCELITRGAAIGIKTYVLHPSRERVTADIREQAFEYATDFMTRLCAFAAEKGARIAVEDLPRECLGNCSSDILRLISGDERIGVCYDTNHILIESAVDFINNVGKRIITLHVSDYDFINERHWLPGEGKIEWQPLIAALKKVGYEGPWLYEVSFECPKTIIRDRDLNCRDFAENARLLFEGKTPAPIGRHKEHLGMWE